MKTAAPYSGEKRFRTPQEDRKIDEGNVQLKRIWNLFAVLIAIGLNGSTAIASKPNIDFIFVDDQGYYDLDCYSAAEVKAPRVDGLAARGDSIH